MPVLVIEDAGRSNSRQVTRNNAARALRTASTVAGPVLGPILAVGSAILGLGGRGSSRTGPTISIDSATGKATVTDARPDETERITQLVEEAYRTGAQPVGERWHRTWTPFIQQAADFGRDVRLGRYGDDTPEPDAPDPDVPDDGDGGFRLGIEGGKQLSPVGEEDFFMPSFVRSIPGGAAGFAQQTPAGMAQMGATASRGGGRRRVKRAKRAKASSGRRRKRAKRAGGKRARMVKGSAAAKAYMARLRKMRKRG